MVVTNGNNSMCKNCLVFYMLFQLVPGVSSQKELCAHRLENVKK